MHDKDAVLARTEGFSSAKSGAVTTHKGVRTARSSMSPGPDSTCSTRFNVRRGRVCSASAPGWVSPQLVCGTRGQSRALRIERLVDELRTGANGSEAAYVLGRIGDPATLDVLAKALRQRDKGTGPKAPPHWLSFKIRGRRRRCCGPRMTSGPHRPSPRLLRHKRSPTRAGTGSRLSDDRTPQMRPSYQRTRRNHQRPAAARQVGHSPSPVRMGSSADVSRAQPALTSAPSGRPDYCGSLMQDRGSGSSHRVTLRRAVA